MSADDDDARLQQIAAALRSAAIAALNDRLRQQGCGGRIMLTQGIQALSPVQLLRIMTAIRTFDGFSSDNDPYGEHDFGAVDLADAHVFWKIDYYDRDLRYASPDPTDAAVTTRVLTIMLAEEY